VRACAREEAAVSRPRKLSPAQAAVARELGPLDGAEIAGGCDHCDAVQTVEPAAAGVWSITVRHDDDCPFLAEYRKRAASS
jgi:hypothetical protein